MYGGYVLFLLLDAVEHWSLTIYSTAMVLFVIPIVALTLAVLAARELRLHRQASLAAQSDADSSHSSRSGP
jgi:cation:H+ antiporter